MRSLRIVLPKGVAFKVDPHYILAVCAALTATWLMMSYVQLLHESVARGNQLRAEQRTPSVLATKAADRGGRVVASSEAL
jgi:hypothetical protein